ncbi:SGNH/GDSL hydrolase family protein [Lactobacillus crispatus]
MSWGQILGRKVGTKVINFSRGGQTTTGWLTDEERGLGLLNKTNPQDLYVLALGINDLANTTLGTKDDIAKQSSTFYGNYAKIVSNILTHAPNAKLVISNLSQAYGDASKFDTAIADIADHFKIPLLNLNSDPFFTSDFYLNHMYGGHPTGPIYAEMANAYERLISQAMVDHLDYFENYEEEAATDNADDLSRITNTEK